MALSRRDLLRSAAAGAVLLRAGGEPLAAARLPLAGAGPVTAGAAGAARLTRAQLRALRAATRGRVLAPGDDGYDTARLVFNERFDGIRPPAVVRVRDAADVRAVVRWAERFGLRLVARSGGHAYDGGSTSRAAVVVDVRGLNAVRLDGSVAKVGPGARTIEVNTALARRGGAIPLGSCPGVAVGGLTLGGGMGLAGRGLGLTLDRVTAFDAVTADGRRRRIDAERDPDLFWALRGGGGGFALVTGVHLRVARHRTAAWFQISYRAEDREELLAAWDDLAPGAPAALTSICTLTGTGATAFGQYLGPEAALRRLVAPLARIGGAGLRAGTSDYLALQRRWAGCAGESLRECLAGPRATFAASSIYVARPLSAAGRRAFVAAADTGATLILDAYGGAIGRVAPDATAFVHRDVRFSVQVLSYASAGTARARVRRARAGIAPYGNGQAYQNYADPDLRDPAAAYYGTNLPRLRRIKAAVDPEGRFKTPQGLA